MTMEDITKLLFGESIEPEAEQPIVTPQWKIREDREKELRHAIVEQRRALRRLWGA